jgi:hypothetical protein
MRKKSILAIIALIGLSSFVVLGSSPGLVGKILESVQDNPITRAFSSESQTDLPKTNVEPSVEVQKSTVPNVASEQKNEVPEYILYEQTFRLVIKFKKKTEELSAKGETNVTLRDYFQKEAKLNDEQTQVLQETAARYMEELSIIDTQARTIIETIRANFAQTQQLPDKKIIEPPAELKELQNKREALALRYRDHLRDSFGPEQFQNFQNFVEQNMRKAIKAKFVDGSKLEPTVNKITPSTRRPLSFEGGLEK